MEEPQLVAASEAERLLKHTMMPLVKERFIMLTKGTCWIEPMLQLCAEI
jgi:hypothetical protein